MLQEALSKEWEAINQSTIDWLRDSIPEWLAGMIKAENSHTKQWREIVFMYISDRVKSA